MSGCPHCGHGWTYHNPRCTTCGCQWSEPKPPPPAQPPTAQELLADKIAAAFWAAMTACGEDGDVDAFDYPYWDEYGTIDGTIPHKLWTHMARLLEEGK